MPRLALVAASPALVRARSSSRVAYHEKKISALLDASRKTKERPSVPYNALLLSFTASASTYTSLPIALNLSDISAMPACCSFNVAA